MGETPYRGGDGPLAVSLCTDPHAGHKAFLAAVAQQQFKVDARYDFNQPTPVNVAGYYQKNILDGKRHSAADAFLTPVLSRPNLEVRSQCQATKLIFEGKRAVGVEYLRDGKPEQARAAREIILSGGVIDSPKLLMLSGIGPADHLKALGIPVVADVAGRRAELPGSPEAVDPLERQDRAAGIDGDGGHVHAIGSGELRRPARPAVLRRPRASRRRIDSSPSPCRWSRRSRAARSAAIGGSAGGADHSRQLPAGTGGRQRAGARRQARALVRRGGCVCGSATATRSCRGRR